MEDSPEYRLSGNKLFTFGTELPKDRWLLLTKHEVHKVMRGVITTYKYIKDKYGINASSYNTLVFVSDSDDIPTNKIIALEIGINLSQAKSTVSALIKEGLIVNISHPSRRGGVFQVSTKGAYAIRDVQSYFKKILSTG